MFSPLLVLGSIAAAFPLAAEGVAPGYYCERRVDKHGAAMPHVGKCQKSRLPCNVATFKNVNAAVTDAVQPFYMPGACNDLPADVTCCMAPPPEVGAVYPDSLPKDMPNGVSKEQLKCCMEYEDFGFPESRDRAYRNALNFALKSFGVTKRSEIAQFLAQVGAESGSLAWWTELDKKGCRKYSGGCRYLGRGPIQLTHDYNYRDAYNWLRRQGILTSSSSDNFVAHPEKVAQAKYGFLTTMWFWRISKRLEQYADDSWKNYFWMSKRINGGTRGIAHRAGRWAKCVKCLGGDSPNIDAYNDVDANPGCTAIGGSCNEANDCGGGFQQSGLCHGRTTKCCIPHDERSPCGIVGGKCGTDGCPGGRKQPGLCVGQDPVCCIREGASNAQTQEEEDDQDAAAPEAREPSECAATAGTCVPSGRGCDGYAVQDVGTKGCPSGSRCCRPACSDIFGFCRGSSDCPGGNQVSRKCPGTSICCVQGTTTAGKEANMRAQALRAIPDQTFRSGGGVTTRAVQELDVLVSDSNTDTDAARPSINDALSKSNGNTFGGFDRATIPNFGNTLPGTLKHNVPVKKFDSSLYHGMNVYRFSESTTAKTVYKKAEDAGISKDIANWWIHTIENVVKTAKGKSSQGDVDTDSLSVIADVAGASKLGRVYDFWTNRFSVSDLDKTSAQFVAYAIDRDELTDEEARKVASLVQGRGRNDRVKTAQLEGEDSNQDSNSRSFLGVDASLDHDSKVQRLQADIARLEKDLNN